jgi:hypothetical protein
MSAPKAGVTSQGLMLPLDRNNPEMKTEPNKAMERSRILVTDRADARSAPSIRLAHLSR